MTEHAKIDPEFKALWVSALRSGKYKQTTGRLTDERGFCCLGVACVIKGDIDFDQVDNLQTSWGLGDEGNLGDVIPGIIEPDADELSSLNDSLHSFSEIADWIEENL